MAIAAVTKSSRATNHIGRTDGRPFPLPSTVGLPLLSRYHCKRPNLARLSESAVSFQIGFSRTWEDLRWHLGPG